MLAPPLPHLDEAGGLDTEDVALAGLERVAQRAQLLRHLGQRSEVAARPVVPRYAVCSARPKGYAGTRTVCVCGAPGQAALSLW